MVEQEGFPCDETGQNGAILKRVRDLLYAQQERFCVYLVVLDKQKQILEQGRVEDSVAHVELEEKIWGDILALKRSIDLLEHSYHGIPKTGREPLVVEILEIKTGLGTLQTKVKWHLEQNKGLLSQKMAVLRSEIKTVRENPLRKRSGVYAAIGTSSFIDIHG